MTGAKVCCGLCGWTGRKIKSHLNASQTNDPPGLRDICPGGKWTVSADA